MRLPLNRPYRIVRLTGVLWAMLITMLASTLTIAAEPDDAGSARPGISRCQALRLLHLQRALNEETELEFIETPISEVAEFIALKHKIPVHLDTQALEVTGNGNIGITIKLSDCTLAQGLEEILQPYALTYSTRKSFLEITTEARLRQVVLIRNYPVADFFADKEPPTEFLETMRLALDNTENTKPSRERLLETFDDQIDLAAQMHSRLSFFRGLLVVRASEIEHRRIENLLDELRRKMNLPRSSAAHPFHGWKMGTQLDLSNLPVTNEDLAELRPTAPLISISIRGTKYLRGPSFYDEWLKQHTQLSSLDLSQTSASDEDLKSVVQHCGKNLQMLQLSETEITDTGLKELSKLNSLKFLSLYNRGDQDPHKNEFPMITVDAVEELRQQLPQCKIDLRGHPWKRDSTTKRRQWMGKLFQNEAESPFPKNE